jgi:hypothetical protein
MLTLKSLYFLWLILNVVTLIASGWFSRVIIEKGVSWSQLIGYQSKLFPFQTLDTAYYDITEFLLYYSILPYIVYRFFASLYKLEKKY